MEEIELKFKIEAAIIKLGLEKEPRVVEHYGQLVEKGKAKN